MNRDTRRTRIVLALLLVVSLAVVTLDYRGGDQSPVDSLRSLAAGAIGPVEGAAAAVVRPVSDTVGALGDLGSQHQRITSLQKKNAELRTKVRTGQLARHRAAELDKLLKVSGTGRYRVTPAQVIAIGSGRGFSWTATLDVGTRDGVRKDMTVLNGDGLVGRVVHASGSTSTVLLAVDATSAVGSRLESSMEIGVVNGAGRDPLQLQLLDPQAKVAAGDRLVTFGSEGDAPYVPGVPVGKVVHVDKPGALTRTATVRPYVDFTSLDLVGVVVSPPRTDPRDSVLPPRPTPSGSTAPSGATASGASRPGG